MTTKLDPPAAEERFRSVFSHIGAVTAYARRRGHPDAESAAAEVMTIAWRRLADIPLGDPRPWLFATARNVVLADLRRTRTVPAREEAARQPRSSSSTLSSTPRCDRSRTATVKGSYSSPGKT